jgi:hypothetical protein
LTFVDWRGKRSKGIPHPRLGIPEHSWRPRSVALLVEAGCRGEEKYNSGDQEESEERGGVRVKKSRSHNQNR